MNKIFAFVKPLIEKFPRLAAIYRMLRDESAFSEEPIKTPWDFKLAGNSLMATGNFEPEETTLIRQLLNEVDVMVNVGANIGYYCCHALSMGKEVIAFEPMCDNIRYLCKNLDINGWACEIYPIALSNKVGILKMYGGGTGASTVKGWAGNSETTFSYAPCSTLDKVLGTRLKGKKVLFIVDVEGAEQWMLEGSESILKNDTKPIWLIEITAVAQQPKGVKINPQLINTFKLMFDAGYTAVTADHSMNSITIKEVKDAQNGEPTILNTIHNFIFR